MRLLVAEDDQALAQRLQSALTQAGFAVDIASDGVAAQDLGSTEPYDVVVLDIGLPERSGLEVLKNWRATGSTIPVIILTARDAWHERVDGFQAGADDYLGKPFYVEELIARLNALIRRTYASSGSPLCAGDLTLDETCQNLITAAGETIPLTGVEFRLMRYFMLHPGQVLSKSQLADHVYDWDTDHESNVLEVYVRRLRQKCGREFIQTRRGQGYIFQVSR